MRIWTDLRPCSFPFGASSLQRQSTTPRTVSDFDHLRSLFFLPLLEGDFRDVLQGNDQNKIEISVENGCPAVEEFDGTHLCQSARPEGEDTPEKRKRRASNSEFIDINDTNQVSVSSGLAPIAHNNAYGSVNGSGPFVA
ncbi:hypothetical protein VNO77_19531 [Canavalia gladiata]|uniref:Uncharacterized protein n=1 Tax=Canavalia gladiata TaxID=3824 RepID=A0AAN9QKK8_CANGL